MDRDSTINKYVGVLRDIDDFEQQPGVAQVIRNINQVGIPSDCGNKSARNCLYGNKLGEITKKSYKMEILLG